MKNNSSQIYLFPEQVKSGARTLVSGALAQNKLNITDYCEICLYDIDMIHDEEASVRVGCLSNKQILEAHHYNYNYPLNVWWLCPSCHKMLHVIQRKLKLACIHLTGARNLINNFRYDYEHSWINEIDDDYGLYEELNFW